MKAYARAPAHLAVHVEHLQAAGQSPRTIQARIRVIRALSAYLGTDPSAATPQQLASWLARPGLARATRAVYRFHLQTWYRWLVDEGYAELDPSARLRKVRAPKGPPRPPAGAVVAEIIRRAVPPYLVYFTLAAYAGLRCQEIATLRREDVDQDVLTIHGKGGKQRLIPTHELVWRHVQALPPGPILHLGRRYEPHVAAHKVSMYSSRALTKLGFPDVTMHRLRHWFGTETFRRTRNIRATQELLGHASVATTERYTEVSSEERRLAIQALPTVAA